MIFRVLGSAAGGGVPQWNCACTNCAAARTGAAPRRSQSAAAVSAGGDRWLLLNCSPDITAQIEAFAPLQPRSLRDTPIDGAMLTDANVDHLGGLAALRQSGNHRFVIRSSGIVRDIAVAQTAFAPFARDPHRWDAVNDDEHIELAGLRLRGFAVPGATPGYAGRRQEPGAVFAYEAGTADADATFLFAPVFSAIDDRLFEAIERVDVAFLDGSFFSDDELIVEGLMDKTARQLGHQPVGGPGGTLERLQGVRTRIIFTHVNNSNPMLDPTSAAALEVRRTGAEIAYDGMML